MKMRIAADHAGFEMKEWIKKEFSEIQWIDHGTENTESVHYPQYAQKLCEDILDHSKPEELIKPLGILICGSGVGMSMQANRYLGIRAALCWNTEIARLSRQHNASNVLCLSARHVEKAVNQEIVKTWISTEFEGGRHTHRIEMMDMDGPIEESCECC